MNDADLKPYFAKRWELTELDCCIIWCSRVLIPPQACDQIPVELHGGHTGGARMKSLAHHFVWWPGMDQSIAEAVSKCTECQQSQPAPSSSFLVFIAMAMQCDLGHQFPLILQDQWTIALSCNNRCILQVARSYSYEFNVCHCKNSEPHSPKLACQRPQFQTMDLIPVLSP